ncbi:TetR family transcriptional regulator [Rhodococcus sp. NPDC057014]|uniref:TetR family transcriptional regulator n=1 Tax=unclassified Rhodococcus (in: high G+C Gram-positive bacteria) TaxID=192944 RepID=UPI00362D1ACB
MTRSETTGATPGKQAAKRTRNPEKTRENILRVAMTEFADKGLTGARIDEIAAKTATTKRMLYYYFGDKDGLYRAVLQRAYEEIRYEESQLDVDHLEPAEAIRALAELTFDHHEAHPDFIRLVAIENTNRGVNLVQAEGLPETQAPAIRTLDRILQRGQDAGIFRTDTTALDIHMLISSYCVFRVANRYTFKALFDWDLTGAENRPHLRAMIGDVVLAYLQQPGKV